MTPSMISSAALGSLRKTTVALVERGVSPGLNRLGAEKTANRTGRLHAKRLRPRGLGDASGGGVRGLGRAGDFASQ